MSTSTLPANNALQALNLLNPLAPPVYGGLETPEGFVDFTYPLDVTLAANALSTEVINTNTDADFQMLAIQPNVYTSIQFSIQININGVYYMSSSPILAGNLVSDPSAPAPVLGVFTIPRGAIITVAMQELSGATNTIEILFRGMKRYGNK